MVRGHFQLNATMSVFVQGKVEIILLLGNIVKVKALFQNTSLYLCYALNLGHTELICCSNLSHLQMAMFSSVMMMRYKPSAE